MTEDFFTEALDYLLDDMDARRRLAFEERMTRFPAARAAVAECAESISMLRRQALEVPFFGRVVRAEIAHVMSAAREKARGDLHRGAYKLRQLVARHA